MDVWAGLRLACDPDQPVLGSVPGARQERVVAVTATLSRAVRS